MKPQNSTESQRWRLVIWFSLGIVAMLPSPVTWAQLSVPAGQTAEGVPLRREFHDTDGQLLVVGQLQKMEGQVVTIAATTGRSEKFSLNRFSREDRIWIRRTIADMEKREAEREEIQRIARGLFSDNPTAIIQTCNRLRKYGPVASHIGQSLTSHLQSDDERVRRAAFVCLAAISETNPGSLNALLQQLRQPDGRIRRAIESRPERFLAELSRFGAEALPYLRAVALTGQLDVAPDAEAVLEAAELADREQRRMRLAACRALAETEPREPSAEVLVAVLEAEAKEPENERTIEQVVRFLGNLGHASSKVTAALESVRSQVPEAVAAAIEDIDRRTSSEQDDDGRS